MNEEVNKLKNKIEELEKKNIELEEKLKSYTNPTRNKKYYENNSHIVKEKAKSYMEKLKETNPEKLLIIVSLFNLSLILLYFFIRVSNLR